jgi:predicted dehydrogenase
VALIRWGIIGVGDVTEVKSGPAFQKASNSELVAVMRRTGHLAEDYARRHNVPKWYDDADALVGDPDVDAIYVATPPSSHREYTIRAAQAGKPVYVEKPMALNFSECQEMIEACQLAGVPLFVAYYRRAQKRFLKIKDLLDTGAIGDARFVTITLYMKPRPEELDLDTLPWRVVPSISGGGRFVDLASHMLDLLDYYLGPIQSVHGFAANQASVFAAEDIVTSTFVFESGVQGTGTWCFTAFDEYDRTEIVGSKGRLIYSTFDDTPIILTTEDDITEIPSGYPEHVQQPLIQTVVNELRGSGICPSPGQSAARTSWVMDQMLRGYYDGS